MKKNNYLRIGTLALLVVIAAPQVSFAARLDKVDLAKGLKGDGTQFCAMIDRRSGDIDLKVNQKLQQLQSRRDDRSAQRLTKRSDRDMQRTQHRTEADTRHDARFDKLDMKAATDVQKAAVIEFKASVNNAVDARRTAIDAAVRDFRSVMDGLIANQKTKVDAAVADFNTARIAAINKAKASCASGVDSVTVKASFDADMTAAKDAFKSAKDVITKKADVEAAITVRKTAVDEAITDFKAAMAAAQDKLKLAFPKTQ